MYTSPPHHGGSAVKAAFRKGLLAPMLGLALLAIAAAIGAKVQTGGTGRTEFGSIEAFGSIVVNGIHYDETGALITIDGVGNQPPSALKLGMVVQIDGTLDPVSLRGVADTVRVSRTLLGQLESGPNSAGEIQVLSQSVALTTATQFDGVASGAALLPGDWVAVHGLEDPGKKTLVATLVERVTPPTGGQSAIRGTVRNAGGDQFRIGALKISASGLPVPGDGDYISVTGSYVPGTGKMSAGAISTTREVETSEDNETEITGYVTDFRSPSTFVIAGVAVDASHASVEGGRLQDVKNGMRITVEGRIRNGVLVAEEIELASPATPASSAKAEMEGTITAFSSLGDFTVRGVRIDASGAMLVNKTRRPPGVGLKAHVKGRVGAEGVLRATSLELEAP